MISALALWLVGCSLLIEADDGRDRGNIPDANPSLVKDGAARDAGATPDGSSLDAATACVGVPALTITVVEPNGSESSVGIVFGSNQTQPRCQSGTCVLCPPANVSVTLSVLTGSGATFSGWNDECPECSFGNCYFFMPDSPVQCTATFDPQ
jgi:hypothetical protein